MKATVWHLHEARNASSATGIPFRLSELQYEHLWGGNPDKYGRVKYREHNVRLRAVAPSNRLLEYEVQQGWEPLCAFLGKDIPQGPFPRADDWAEYKKEQAMKGARAADSPEL